MWWRLPAVAALTCLLSCGGGGPGGGGTGERIVSLAPSTTELVWALEAGEMLVGRSSADDYPPEVLSVPVVGDFGIPNAEALLRAGPTLVLLTGEEPDSCGRLLATLGLETFTVRAGTVAELEASILALGRRLHRDAQAEALLAELEAARREVAGRARGKPAPRVYVEVWHDPLTTVGRTSFVADLVRLCGGVNVFDEVAEPYFAVSSEAVVAADPDVVIVPGAHGGAPDVAAREGWSQMKAVREGRVYAGDIDPALLFRPGPRTPQGLRALSRLLFPEEE